MSTMNTPKDTENESEFSYSKSDDRNVSAFWNTTVPVVMAMMEGGMAVTQCIKI